MIKPKDQWIKQSKYEKLQIFFFEDRVLDLTKFQYVHPGGKKALANYVYKDITDIIFTVYPHKKEPTLNILLSYVIGKIPLEDMKQNTRAERPVTPTKQKKKVHFAQNSVRKSGVKQKKSTVNENSLWECSQTNKTTSVKKPKSKSKSKKGSKAEEKLLSINALTDNTERPKIASLTDTLDIDEYKPAFRIPVLKVKNMMNIG